MSLFAHESSSEVSPEKPFAKPATVPADEPRPTAAPVIRILLIVEATAAGTGRHVLDLAQGLLSRGCEVHLLYATHRIDKLFTARLPKMPTLVAQPLNVGTEIRPHDFRAMLDVRRYAREHGPFDIIHGHSSKGGALARLAAFGTRSKAFYTIHGLVTIDKFVPPIRRAVYFSIEWLLSRISSRIIAVAPEEQRCAIACGMGKRKVLCIPNGIEELENTPREIARQTIGVSDDKCVVGFIGRLVDQKAPHILIQAFAKAAEQSKSARLAIVGSGPLEPSLRKIAEDAGITDKIIWLGGRDARTVLAGFDLFAISSRKEGLPYVVLEAMVTGLPIIATNASSVEILVRSGINGDIVPTDDVDAFGEALTRILLDPDRRRRYAEASRQMSKAFSIDDMIESTLSAYRDVINERDGIRR